MAVKDKNGNFITASQPFTPNTSEGKTTVTFKFDASDVTTEAVSYVVFETLYDKSGKVKFATHTDISDDSQSVHQPKIGTTAKGTDGRKELLYTQGKFIDTVSYTNLESETLYKLVGIAMDKKTGEKLVLNGKNVTAEKEFTSVKANRDNGTAEGTWDLEFTVSEDQYEDWMIRYPSVIEYGPAEEGDEDQDKILTSPLKKKHPRKRKTSQKG